MSSRAKQNVRRSESEEARYTHRQHSTWQDPTSHYITSQDGINAFVTRPSRARHTSGIAYQRMNPMTAPVMCENSAEDGSPKNTRVDAFEEAYATGTKG